METEGICPGGAVGIGTKLEEAGTGASETGAENVWGDVLGWGI
jgi:hypothetical protein